MSAWVEKREKYGTVSVRWKFRESRGRIKCSNISEARKLAAEISASHARGILWRPRNDNLKPRLADICRAYLERHELSKRPNTLKSWHGSLSLFLRFLRLRKPRGRLSPALLSEDTIQDFYRFMVSQRKTKSSTARTRAIHASMFWEWASTSAEFGEVVPRFVRAPLPQLDAPEPVSAPAWSMCDKAIETARTSSNPQSEYHCRVMIVARFTGLRVHQILGLRWSDFDINACKLRVRGELGKTRNERRGRTVPVSEHFVAEISTWGRREGWLIDYPTRGTSTHSTPTAGVRNHWRESGVDSRFWRGRPVHCFRKAFASELIMRGADRFAVEMLCGRSTGMQDTYLDPLFLWSSMVEAVSLIPPLGVIECSIDERRSRGPSGVPAGSEFVPGRAVAGREGS